jgi:NAD(P)-dependent dehydrogenase (short-subunit alcohol dehydrogenase family)
VRDNPEVNRQVAEMTALGRAGVPDDVGPMVAALLSDENGWVNGQRIEVSGGAVSKLEVTATTKGSRSAVTQRDFGSP